MRRETKGSRSERPIAAYLRDLHVRVTAENLHGRKVTERCPKPGRPDDNWFDCVEGCFVSASILGQGRKGRLLSPKEAGFAASTTRKT